MLQIKALNDESSRSRDEDEFAEIKESEEERIFALYNESLNQYLNHEYERAAAGMEEVLASPLLNGQDILDSPLHKQIRLGCLKNLSQIYISFPEPPDYEAAKTKIIQTIQMDQTVVNWINLGEIGIKLLDYGLAAEAFAKAHLTSPSHWDPIENLITLNYVLSDYITCLQFCSIGLESDSSFVKGQVFRDLCLEADPDLKEVIEKKHPEWNNLFVDLPSYDLYWKDKFHNEARNLIDKYKESIRSEIAARQIEDNDTQSFSFHPSTFAELIENILIVKAFTFKNGFRKKYSISWNQNRDQLSSIIQNGSKSDEDATKDLNVRENLELSETTQEEMNGRSKSPCEEQENQTDQKDSESFCDTSTQEIADDSLGLSNQGNDLLSKKKNKKDVKWWQLEGKRRSQRVRGLALPISSQCGNKREHCFSDMLRKIIPPSLLFTECNGHLEEINSKREKKLAKVVSEYFGSEKEALDVQEFLLSSKPKEHLTLTVDLFNFLINKKFENKWPPHLTDEFSKLNSAYRSFLIRPDPNFVRDDESLILSEGFNTLKVAELLFDRLSLASFGLPKLEKAFNREMKYLIQISFAPQLSTDEFQIRFYWLRGNFALHLANSGNADYNDVASYFQFALFHLEKMSGDSNVGISIEDVKQKLSFIERMENIDRTNTLHKEEKYDELIAILEPYLKAIGESQKEILNRFYLTEAYFKRGMNREALEESLLLLRFSVNSSEPDPTIQENTIRMIEEIVSIEEKLSFSNAQSLIDSILKLLTQTEKNFEFTPILTSLWVLTHKILFQLEKSEPALYIEEDAVPNSILLLQFAHEYFARLEKCIFEGGKLLKYIIQTLFPLMDSEEYGSHDETKFCLEQAFYCLYGHPSKKLKLKYLNEHPNSGGTNGNICLQWDDCPILFEYYKPKELPEFDSYDSISSDQEILFKRILAAMPQELKRNPPPTKPKLLYDELMKIKLVEDSGDGLVVFNDIYYLLGDHYFKAKEFTKAIEYYFQDIFIVPRRFDSWACIALSTGEEVNTQLNSFDDFEIDDILNNANIVVLSFQNALSLDQSNSKVRIEFGSFVYSMDSFCSRLLKYNADRLSLEQFEVIERKKDEFIKIAAECFEPIVENYSKSDDNEHQEEIWIHHYMLGKVLEKIHPGKPDKFLEQYEIAAALLHIQQAPYPLKINYYNAPELAIEALEIYYRIHASALAYVDKHEYNEEIENVLLKYLKTSAESPFVQARISKSLENMEAKRKKCIEETAKKEQKIIEAVVDDIIKRIEEDESRGSPNDLPFNLSNSLNVEDENPSTQSSLELRVRAKKLRGGKDRKNEPAEGSGRGNGGQVGRPPLKKTVSMDQTEVDLRFKDVKFGKVVYECVKALEECVARFPQHHKSNYRISCAYSHFLKDWIKGREYLLGSNEKDKRVFGLFGDRKPNNFFNGVLRNPIDDIDRPGSFPYHMSKAVQHMLEILNALDDHQMLAEVGIQFSKLPDIDKKYLYNFEREQFSQQAFSSCLAASKRFLETSRLDYKLVAISIFETYLKMQKFNSKDNPLSGILISTAKMAIMKRGEIAPVDIMTCEQAFKSLQYLSWTVNTNFGKQSHTSQGSKRGLQSEKKKRELGDAFGDKTSLGLKPPKNKSPMPFLPLMIPDSNKLKRDILRGDIAAGSQPVSLSYFEQNSLYYKGKSSSIDPTKTAKNKKRVHDLMSFNPMGEKQGEKPSDINKMKKRKHLNSEYQLKPNQPFDSVSAMLNLFLGSNSNLNSSNFSSAFTNLAPFLDPANQKSVPTTTITKNQIEKAFLSSKTGPPEKSEKKMEKKEKTVRTNAQEGTKKRDDFMKQLPSSTTMSAGLSLKTNEKTEELVKISSTYTGLTNTSPFKGQLNFLTSPTEFCRKNNSALEVDFMTPPPKAHSNPRSCKPKTFLNEENPDVIDLTVKTPSPDKKAPISLTERFENSGLEKEKRNYPLPPKKKHLELFKEPKKLPPTPTTSDLNSMPFNPPAPQPKEVIYIDD